MPNAMALMGEYSPRRTRITADDDRLERLHGGAAIGGFVSPHG